MDDIIKVETISEVHDFMGLDSPGHPLVTVIREFKGMAKMQIRDVKYSMNLYSVNFKGGRCGTLTYGRSTYDYQEGTMVFTAPGQTMGFDNEEGHPDYMGNWTLLFHPDLIRKSPLGVKIDNYSFFNYDVREALHLSDEEKESLGDIISRIEKEISGNIDAHSQELIISNIRLLLDYCTRYFDRQFYTRTNMNKDVVSRFETVLKNYYSSGRPTELGIPTVKYLGGEMGMSPYYLSDLLKKETGRNTLEHIHFFIIEKAKTTLLNSNNTISEIAYNLGFDYPQHFAKVFKNKTGLSPAEYRKMEI